MNKFNLGDVVRFESAPRSVWRIVRIEIDLFDRPLYRVVLLGSGYALYRSIHEKDLELVEPYTYEQAK